MLTKTMPLAALDFAPDLLDGEFSAMVAVFGNVDSDGDRIVPGAFSGTLARWTAKGDPIPIIWSHQWMDPFAHIGTVVDAEQTDAGLKVHGALDLDNQLAEQVRRLMVARRVTSFSFAYDTLDSRTADDGATELIELELYEVGPTLVGANQLTELLGAKAMADVLGREVLDTPDVGALRRKANALRLRASTLREG